MTSGATLPVVILICIVGWVVRELMFPATIPVNEGFMLSSQFDISHWPYWLNRLCNILLFVIVGYLMIELNNRSDIFHVRHTVLAAIYFLFMIICPEFNAFSLTSISLLAFLLSMFFLFQTYQCRNASEGLFHSFAFLGIGSLFFPQIIYLFPVWLIGSSMLQSLNARSFFAAVLGFVIPYWALLAYALYVGNIDVFFSPFLEIARFGSMDIFETLSIPRIVSLSFFMLLFIIAMFRCLAIDYDNKIRTRIILHFIILLNFCLYTFIILQPVYETSLLILALPGTAMMTCHFFVRTRSRFSATLFYGAMVLLLLIYILGLMPNLIHVII